jgi:hypothetical protein
MSHSGGAIVATTTDIVLDENTILADRETGMPVYEWLRDDTIVNKIDIKFDFNEPDLVRDDFARRQVYVADRSRDRHGAQSPMRFELRGIRTTQGGEALMDDLALIYMQRWGYAPPRLKVSTVYLNHLLEPGDRIPVTHSLIKNPITGNLGLDRELFEVIHVSPSFLLEGKLDVELLWVGAIETSPVPTKTLSNLIPGVSQVDPSDVPIPLSGSVTVQTFPDITKFRIGLKRQTYRVWRCDFAVQASSVFPKPGSCIPAGIQTLRRSYSGSVTYRMDFKTLDAPDTTGTDDDPTTGWVPLLASQTRGSADIYNDGQCGGADPPVPGEERFDHFFETPEASPNTYQIKVFWTAVGTQSNPCGGLATSICDVDPLCAGESTLDSSTLEADVQAFGVDFVEGIS